MRIFRSDFFYANNIPKLSWTIWSIICDRLSLWSNKHLGEKMLWMIVLSSMDMHHDKLNGKKGRPKLQIRGDMLEYYVDSVYFDPDGNYSRSVHINSSKKTLGNKYFNFL